MVPTDVPFLERDHVIVGVEENGYIYPICNLFEEEHVYVVFDIIEQWETLTYAEFLQMGPYRFLSLVRVRDLVAAILMPTSNDPLQQRAHIEACRAANHATNETEAEEARHADHSKPTPPHIFAAIKREYKTAYDIAFRTYLRTVQNNPDQHH